MAGLHSNSKTYQQLESWLFRGWLVGSCCCSATRPLFACPPPPVPASSRRRSIRFAKCRIHVSILRPQTSKEEALFFGLPCFVDGDSIKGRTQRRLRALHSVEGRGKERAFQPPHHGTPVEHGLANSCWQAGRSGRDGVMLQGAPVSRDLVGLSDRAGSDAATSDHQTEPTSTLHPDEPESTPPHAYYPPSCCQPFDRIGISKHMGAGPRCLLACCVSGWLQDSVGIHKHISRSSSALTTWLRADRGGFQAPTPPVRQMKAGYLSLRYQLSRSNSQREVLWGPAGVEDRALLSFHSQMPSHCRPRQKGSCDGAGAGDSSTQNAKTDFCPSASAEPLLDAG